MIPADMNYMDRESIQTVGVLLNGIANPFLSCMLNVVQTELDKRRYTMLLQQVEQNVDEIDAAAALVREKNPRGLIFLGGSFHQNTGKLAHLGIASVMVTGTIQKDVSRENFSSVTIDDYQAGYDLAVRIYDAGHRKIAVIGHIRADFGVSRLRIDGFTHALRERGVIFGHETTAYAGEYTMRGGYNAAVQLIQKTKVTCIFCVSDLIAIGAMRALHDCRMSVPGDVSVIGFDGIDEGRYFVPSLATVKQPDAQMALEAVDILMNRLEQEKPNEHRVCVPEFLEGESFRSFV